MSRIGIIFTLKRDGKKVQETVFLEEGSTVIRDEMFEMCTTLISVVIPEGVTEIRESAFSGCKKLANVEFPNSLKWIAAWAFDGCKKLKKVKLPKGVEISEYAFPKNTTTVC